jgi:hypothetical protein
MHVGAGVYTELSEGKLVYHPASSVDAAVLMDGNSHDMMIKTARKELLDSGNDETKTWRLEKGSYMLSLILKTQQQGDGGTEFGLHTRPPSWQHQELCRMDDCLVLAAGSPGYGTREYFYWTIIRSSRYAGQSWGAISRVTLTIGPKRRCTWEARRTEIRTPDFRQ